MNDDTLLKSIKKALSDLEERGDIVLCSKVPDNPAKHVYDVVRTLVPSEELTLSELSGLRSLVFQAIGDEQFFDWEMPTLTGFKAEEFKEIAEKLPQG